MKYVNEFMAKNIVSCGLHLDLICTQIRMNISHKFINQSNLNFIGNHIKLMPYKHASFSIFFKIK